MPLKSNARYDVCDRKKLPGKLGARNGYRYLVWDRRYGDVYFFEGFVQSLEFIGEPLTK